MGTSMDGYQEGNRTGAIKNIYTFALVFLHLELDYI